MNNPLKSVKVSGIISSLTLISIVAAGAVLYNNGKVDAIRPDINKTKAVIYLPESVDNSHLNGTTEQPFYEDIQVTDADHHQVCERRVTFPTYVRYLDEFANEIKSMGTGVGVTYHYSGLDISQINTDVSLTFKQGIEYGPDSKYIKPDFDVTGGYILSKFVYEYLTDPLNIYNTANNQSNIKLISDAQKTLNIHLTNLKNSSIGSKKPSDVNISNDSIREAVSNALRAWYIQTYLGISNVTSIKNRSVAYSTPIELFGKLRNTPNTATVPGWNTARYLKDLKLKFYSTNNDAFITLNNTGSMKTSLKDYIDSITQLSVQPNPIQVINTNCFTIDNINFFLSNMSYKSVSKTCLNTYKKTWKAETSINDAAFLDNDDKTSYVIAKSCGCSNLIFIVHHPDGLPQNVIDKLDKLKYDTDVEDIETYLKDNGKLTENTLTREFYKNYITDPNYEENSDEDKLWIIDAATSQ